MGVDAWHLAGSSGTHLFLIRTLSALVEPSYSANYGNTMNNQPHFVGKTWCFLRTLWCLFNTTFNIFQTFNFLWRKLLIAAAEPAFNSLHVASSGPVAKMNSSQRPLNWLHRLPTNGNQVSLLSAAGVRCVHIWLSSTALSIRHSWWSWDLLSFLKKYEIGKLEEFFPAWNNAWIFVGVPFCWESLSLAGIFQPKNVCWHRGSWSLKLLLFLKGK